MSLPPCEEFNAQTAPACEILSSFNLFSKQRVLQRTPLDAVSVETQNKISSTSKNPLYKFMSRCRVYVASSRVVSAAVIENSLDVKCFQDFHFHDTLARASSCYS